MLEDAGSTLRQHLRLLRQRVEQHPDAAEPWRQLAQALQDQGQLEEALPCWERAGELEPNHLGSQSALGHLCRNLALPERAIEHHARALALQPDSLTLALNHAFVLPVVATNAAEQERYRQRCLGALDQLERHQHWRWFPEHLFTCHPFYLAYSQHNEVEALRRYGELLTRTLAPLPRQLPSPGPKRPPRLGLLSGFFYEHSHARAFEGLITGLEGSRLETILIHLATAPSDAVGARLGQACSRVVRLSPRMAEARQMLADLELDVLFFTDLGMHPQMTLLALQRLAPIQITGWGMPMTSGLPRIDHYISATAVEPAEAQSHYCEGLVRLRGLPCSYPARLLQAPALGREHFLLPPDELLVGCLQPMQKLHPDFDAVLEAIAVAVPEAWFVFVRDLTPSLTERFLERLAVAAPRTLERSLVLARQDRASFMALAGCLDLLLDPPYFGSGVSFFEIAHTGTPLVTLEGRFLRDRLVAAAYRLIGLEEAPVAGTLAEYGALAQSLLRDGPRRRKLRQELGHRARASLYDRQDCVRDFEAFVLEAVERQRVGLQGL
ncbi:MAG: tetratricopeptide repeat protein [Synechococcaceae cyanobacterium]